MGGSFFDDPKELVLNLIHKSAARIETDDQDYPNFFNTNVGTLELLTKLIEEFRPSVVVETGVANGRSTRQILSAFKQFELQNSRLISMDIDSNVVKADLRENEQFEFRLIDSPIKFKIEMANIFYCNIFYHDSDHSYSSQMMEYETAWEILDPENGILISDDVNWSNAFRDFCKKVNRSPFLLADCGKFSGVISKPVWR